MNTNLPFQFISVDSAISLLDARGHVLTLMDECGFFLCQHGSIDVSLNDKSYLMKEGNVYYYMPSTYVSILGSSPDLEGIVVKCNIEFVMPLIQHLFDSGHYLTMRDNPCIMLSEQQRTAIERLAGILNDHLSQAEAVSESVATDLMLKQVILSLAQSLFYELMYAYKSNQGVVPQAHNAHDNIFQQFLISLFKNYKQEREVTFYATEQSLSPRYFSSIVKERSGHSALQWIIQMVISSTKQELANTDRTIKEIALDFNFPSQSFFGKYFKQYVGLSPKAYRRQVRTSKE